MKFIDQATIFAKAGNGGHGCIAFKRERHRPKGGPCGGDGGHGGNIILKVNPQLTTLQDVSYNRHYKAERGQHGQGSDKHGKKGKNLIIPIPPGTIIMDVDSEEILGDFVNNDDEIVICKGGNGGFGNARFKTHSNTAPKIANDGQLGEERTISLELKVLADVGLVGFPNAGKSTFISVVSSARPKIANYPFTTLVPNLGIVKYGEYKSFVMADIPGLISGAAEGRGLGSQFLKHIERTEVLVYLIDGTSENITEQFETLKAELANHNSELPDRPSLLVLTKSDLYEDTPQNIPNDIEYLQISSVTHSNIPQSVQKISSLLVSRKHAQS